jgi:hypothetical protein
MVEALRPVFSDHPDEKLRETKVTIDFPKDRQHYPAVVVRFYEQEINNAGVGHEENLVDDNNQVWKFKHYFYTGDIEFAIYALSSLDRDLIADTIVQTITMGSLTDYTNNFFSRIYPPNSAEVPDSAGHYININSDKINGFSENQTPVPWQSEDDLIYNVSYRTNVWGEFYSLPPELPYDYVSGIFNYPYIAGVDDVPTGSDDSADWS